jgi:hypothetical protein
MSKPLSPQAQAALWIFVAGVEGEPNDEPRLKSAIAAAFYVAADKIEDQFVDTLSARVCLRLRAIADELEGAA